MLSNHVLGPQPEASIRSESTDDIEAQTMTSPAEDNSSIVTSPSDPVTAVTPVSTRYDRAVKIHRLWKTMYVFPDASTSISQAHKDRYPVLKDILQRNIESSPQLCDYTTCISYELRMCGSCVADAIPSILVFCPFGKLKKIKSLLQQPHIRSQFEPETTTSEFVNFGIFFWARKIDMLAFHEIVAVIPVEQATGGVVANATGVRAPSGLRIYNGENGEMNTATMGCMIQVGRDQFGLTTAHAFHQTLATTCGPDDSDSDDEEYDMSIEQDDHSEVTMDVQPALPIDGRGQTVQLESVRSISHLIMTDSSARLNDNWSNNYQRWAFPPAITCSRC